MKDTNPDHYKADGANFIEYMNDPKIAGFGNWMFANGFNSGVWASTNWISVKDRLPEQHEEDPEDPNDPDARYTVSDPVLVYDGKYITIGVICEDTWDIDGLYGGKGTVTHWMPLPEPPKEAGRD